MQSILFFYFASINQVKERSVMCTPIAGQRVVKEVPAKTDPLLGHVTIERIFITC
jgi:hypothetical protein